MRVDGPIHTRLTSFRTAGPRNGAQGRLHTGLCGRAACTSQQRGPRIFKLLTNRGENRRRREGWKASRRHGPCLPGARPRKRRRQANTALHVKGWTCRGPPRGAGWDLGAGSPGLRGKGQSGRRLAASHTASLQAGRLFPPVHLRTAVPPRTGPDDTRGLCQGTKDQEHSARGPGGERVSAP